MGPDFAAPSARPLRRTWRRLITRPSAVDPVAAELLLAGEGPEPGISR